jgi:hypothetical protein
MKYTWIKGSFVFAKRNIEPKGISIDDVWLLDWKTWNIYFIGKDQVVLLSPDDWEEFPVDKTGDQFDKKICNVCHKLLPIAQFDKNQNWKNNRTVRRPSCFSCRILIDWKWVSNADKKKWKSLQPKQEPFECPICNKRTIAWVTSKVVLDHNHLTWHVRWWICDSCNTWLWRFKDDIDLMKRAIAFLGAN